MPFTCSICCDFTMQIEHTTFEYNSYLQNQWLVFSFFFYFKRLFANRFSRLSFIQKFSFFFKKNIHLSINAKQQNWRKIYFHKENRFANWKLSNRERKKKKSTRRKYWISSQMTLSHFKSHACNIGLSETEKKFILEPKNYATGD